jgi:hypothetical protein
MGAGAIQPLLHVFVEQYLIKQRENFKFIGTFIRVLIKLVNFFPK